ncbi:MAG TPA: hypothetical protein VFN03_06460 [Trueperaceae bacterium]|nr:hypothetical protein [Trueperaceae bacterium]
MNRPTDTGTPARGGLDRPSAAAREVVRASSPVAAVVASLLLALYPKAELYRVGADVERLVLDPAPAAARLERLKAMLFDLADRPEWQARHLVTREVSDGSGPRLEALLPVAPDQYRSGALLVGPFATEALADEWGADHAVSTLSYDVFSMSGPSTGSPTGPAATGSVWLCDLFDIPNA